MKENYHRIVSLTSRAKRPKLTLYTLLSIITISHDECGAELLMDKYIKILIC